MLVACQCTNQSFTARKSCSHLQKGNIWLVNLSPNFGDKFTNKMFPICKWEVRYYVSTCIIASSPHLSLFLAPLSSPQGLNVNFPLCLWTPLFRRAKLLKSSHSCSYSSEQHNSCHCPCHCHCHCRCHCQCHCQCRYCYGCCCYF